MIGVFEFNSEKSEWVQLGDSIFGNEQGSGVGHYVSLSDDGLTLAVGGPQWSTARGVAKVYTLENDKWQQKGSSLYGRDSKKDFFGWAVKISGDGNTLVASAIGDDTNGRSSGSVKVFTWDGNDWNQMGNNINGDGESSALGRAISISYDGTVLAVGAPSYIDSRPGTVRVYKWNGSSWVQRGDDLEGDNLGDYFGRAVWLSSDGNTLAAGAPRVTVDGGENTGSVKVFKWNGQVWYQLGDNIDGEARYDQSGFSLSLSSNGSRIAIGALTNETEEGNKGHVRIYDWNGESWKKVGPDIDNMNKNGRLSYFVGISGNGQRVIASTDTNGQRAYVYEISESTYPKITIENNQINEGEISNKSSSTIKFISENEIINFDVSDINVSGGYIKDFKSISTTEFEAELIADRYGVVQLQIPVGKYNNSDGNLNISSSSYYYTYFKSKKLGEGIHGEDTYDRMGGLSATNDLNIIAASSIEHNSKKGHLRTFNWDGALWNQLGNSIEGQDELII